MIPPNRGYATINTTKFLMTKKNQRFDGDEKNEHDDNFNLNLLSLLQSSVSLSFETICI
jgi:hypothetical protein